MRRQSSLFRGVQVTRSPRTRPDTSWMDTAACTTTDLPWIAEPQDVSEFQQAAMRAACRVCPVLDACRDYATERRVIAGYWAGLPRNRTTNRDTEPGPATEDEQGTGS